MSSSRALRAGVVSVAVALIAAMAFERVYDVSFRLRAVDPLDVSGGQPVPTSPLPLRLVDSAGA
jgi:hypothetical protein